MGQSVLNEDLCEQIKLIIAQTQAMTLNSEAKVIENLLLRVSKLETTVNDKPRDEVEEVSHSFTAEVMVVSVPNKL